MMSVWRHRIKFSKPLFIVFRLFLICKTHGRLNKLFLFWYVFIVLVVLFFLLANFPVRSYQWFRVFVFAVFASLWPWTVIDVWKIRQWKYLPTKGTRQLCKFLSFRFLRSGMNWSDLAFLDSTFLIHFANILFHLLKLAQPLFCSGVYLFFFFVFFFFSIIILKSFFLFNIQLLLFNWFNISYFWGIKMLSFHAILDMVTILEVVEVTTAHET